jgi:hypothetical protein
VRERRSVGSARSRRNDLASADDLRAFDGELRLVKALAHYTGDRREEIRQRFSRVHDDVLYEKRL